mmetsp:Transcript_11524/g.43231  ORF Transcript_11524/g.43231 Transcript_11524/m.43231 type:complete len:196 (-) Transcript_11524:181-768(-)
MMAPPKNPKKCIYFWRPQDPRGEYGQWFDSPFQTVPSDKSSNEQPVKFLNAEQYMMWRKALLFNDPDVAKRILGTKDPKQVKALGRAVKGFNQEDWDREKLEIVIEGNYLKFTQNAELKAMLLATGDRYMVEASPLDRIWGIGLNEASAREGEKWRGQNLLGIALMKARERIREEEEKEEEGEEKAEQGDSIWKF